MHVSTITFCSSSRYSHHVHDSSMLARHALRFPNTKVSRGYPTATDDTIFFIKGSMKEARNLSTLLDLFADFLGLQINHTKSSLVSFDLTREEGFNARRPWKH